MFKLETFYQSKEWITFRQVVISKRIMADKQRRIICEHCGQPIINQYDCIAHHKIELTAMNVNDLNISLNESNIMLVHHNCHDEIHNRFGHNKQEVYIVWGSPCAGKLDYVKSVIHRNDIVIDMDLMYNMINPINGMYNKPDTLYKVVKALYDTSLENVLRRNGFWHRAYIVTCECLPLQLNRMAEMYRGRLIHVDTRKDECVNNLMKDEAKALYRSEWLKYIDKYWLKMSPQPL